MTSLLITGAGSGIGRALAERAIRRGDRVIAAIRPGEDAGFLGNDANLKVIPVDVASTRAVADGFAEADRWLAGTPLKVVINCAGSCPLGALEVQPIEVIEQTLNTNAIGSARVLRESLPRLRGHDGRVVLVSSLWGKVSGPMLSAYCASKFAIEAIADSARRETQGQNLHIIVAEPGVVRTPLVSTQVNTAKVAADSLSSEHKQLYAPLYRGYAGTIEKNANGGLSAEACAAAIERIAFAQHPKPRYAVGGDSKVVTTLARLLPDGPLDGLLKTLFK